MEKYYIAAKNLHKIDDKTLKFEDFETIMIDGHNKNILRKVYKFFDKYSSQLQKV